MATPVIPPSVPAPLTEREPLVGSKKNASQRYVKQGLEFALRLQEYFVHAYAVLILLTIGVCSYFGSTEVLQYLLSLSTKWQGMWQKTAFMYVCVTFALFLCLPVVPILILCGFVVNDWERAIAANAAGLVTATYAQYLIARSHQAIVKESLSTRFPAFFRVAHVLATDSQLIFLFRFVFFPLFAKNFLAGVLSFPPNLFLFSVVLHSVYLGGLFAWVGSVSRDVTKTVLDTTAHSPTTSNVSDYYKIAATFMVSVVATIWFVLLLYFSHRRALLGDHQQGGFWFESFAIGRSSTITGIADEENNDDYPLPVDTTDETNLGRKEMTPRHETFDEADAYHRYPEVRVHDAEAGGTTAQRSREDRGAAGAPGAASRSAQGQGSAKNTAPS
ncbi:unnamed protein product [Amoebophrya sp. A120]|nr:unnamed protein product [Amoebophrya sp. A120]|eukprot:GSA120T00016578001.1